MSVTHSEKSRLTAPDPAVLAAVEAAVPGITRTRATDRLGMAHDASHYLLTPQAVLVPESAEQVAALMRAGLPLTFRSGGTSLSGQGVSEHLLVDTRRHFRGIEVLDGGARVRVQPGAVLRQINARLAAHGRKLGPDPASESACTIGGVVANNSSGMTCGTHANTYRTLESLVLVLPSGTVVDTAAPDADARLRALEPELAQGLERLRDRIRGNPESVRRVTAQFSLKNTMGYGLNSFLDHDTPPRSSPTSPSAARGPWASSRRRSCARSRRTAWPRRACSSSPRCAGRWRRCRSSSPPAPPPSSCWTPSPCGWPSGTPRPTTSCAR